MLSATNRSFSLLIAFLTALIVGSGVLFYIAVNYGLGLLETFESLGDSQL